MQTILTDRSVTAFKGRERRQIVAGIAIFFVLLAAVTFDREERRFNVEYREHTFFPPLRFLLTLIEGVGVEDALSMQLDY